MKKLIGVMTIALCTTAGISNGCMIVLEDGTYLINSKCFCGRAYIEGCEAAILAVGEGYGDSKDSAESADEHLAPGEHPLDDENIDDWDGNLK